MFEFFKKLFQRSNKNKPKNKASSFRKIVTLLANQQMSEQVHDEIESLLLQADVGVKTTSAIIAELQQYIYQNSKPTDSEIHNELKRIVKLRLQKLQQPFTLKQGQTNVIMMVGINGVGKTTTIGKLCAHLKQQGLSILLAAGDTFRAAAVEQLQNWGQRNDVKVISQTQNADSAAVVFDAIASAKAKNIDVVIADTSGRLGNKVNLMQQMEKIHRVAEKALEQKLQHCLLVLDATLGQNTLEQVKQFCSIIPVSGIVMTKLDGSSKGGILLALAEQFQLPVFFIGVGEKLHQLQEFDPELVCQTILDL